VLLRPCEKRFDDVFKVSKFYSSSNFFQAFKELVIKIVMGLKNVIIGVIKFLLQPKHLLIIIIVLAILATPIYYFVNEHPAFNLFCTNCHNMVPFYEGIKDTSHGAFNCHVCHPLGPEVISEAFIQLVENPSAEEVKERGHAKLRILDQCLRCHTWGDLKKDEVHVVHEGVIYASKACNVCHHPHFSNETDRLCAECHNYERQYIIHAQLHNLEYTSSCSRCHTFNPTSYVPPADICLQGVVEGKACKTCHAQLTPPDIAGKPCTQCHFVQQK